MTSSSLLSKKYKLKETVDVFLSEHTSTEALTLTFHFMTTRDRLEIKTNKNVACFISAINGKCTVSEISDKLGHFSSDEIEKLLNFLLKNGIIFDTENHLEISPRFQRQVAFWDDFVLDRSGAATQKTLSQKEIVLFGCGSVGSSIIEILTRSGIEKISLIDYKSVTSASIGRHRYCNVENIGQTKVAALKDFLQAINQNVNITTHCQRLLPQTNISEIIPNTTSLIINTCDEPYIGHTSLKIGRYAASNKIPLYVAGGFDAHLMSSGELVDPPSTPCIDCIQNSFQSALTNWKPTYCSLNKKQDNNISYDANIISGGPGGLLMLNDFSANLSCMRLLHFLLDDPHFSYENQRIEYLINQGDMTRFVFQKQKGCQICNV